MLAACTMPSSYLGYALIAQTNEPTLVTSNSGTRTGTACGTNILSIFSSGDMSVEAAKAQGKIKTVTSVDRQVTNYVVYAKVCTVVTGN